MVHQEGKRAGGNGSPVDDREGRTGGDGVRETWRTWSGGGQNVQAMCGSLAAVAVIVGLMVAGGVSADPRRQPQEVLSFSAIRTLTDEFMRRGYVRRADTDVIRQTQQGPVVMLGFEKPGLPLTDGQPVIFFVPGIAQVWGAVLSSQGGLSISTVDSPVTIGAMDGDHRPANIGPLDFGPGPPDHHPCGLQPFPGPCQIYNGLPPGAQELVDCCAINLVAGFVGGRGTPLGVAAGAISSLGCFQQVLHDNR